MENLDSIPQFRKKLLTEIGQLDADSHEEGIEYRLFSKDGAINAKYCDLFKIITNDSGEKFWEYQSRERICYHPGDY